MVQCHVSPALIRFKFLKAVFLMERLKLIITQMRLGLTLQDLPQHFDKAHHNARIIQHVFRPIPPVQPVPPKSEIKHKTNFAHHSNATIPLEGLFCRAFKTVTYRIVCEAMGVRVRIRTCAAKQGQVMAPGCLVRAFMGGCSLGLFMFTQWLITGTHTIFAYRNY